MTSAGAPITRMPSTSAPASRRSRTASAAPRRARSPVHRIVDSLALLDKSRLDIPLDAALENAIAWGNESIGFIACCRPQLAGMSTTLTAVALPTRART